MGAKPEAAAGKGLRARRPFVAAAYSNGGGSGQRGGASYLAHALHAELEAAGDGRDVGGALGRREPKGERRGLLDGHGECLIGPSRDGCSLSEENRHGVAHLALDCSTRNSEEVG